MCYDDAVVLAKNLASNTHAAVALLREMESANPAIDRWYTRKAGPDGEVSPEQGWHRLVAWCMPDGRVVKA